MCMTSVYLDGEALAKQNANVCTASFFHVSIVLFWRYINYAIRWSYLHNGHST